MKPAPLFFVLVTFSVFGSIFLGLVAGLANVVTNEYVDYSLPGNPIVKEYDFRVGGKYQLLTLCLLLGGSVLAIGGNIMGSYALYEHLAVKQQSREEKKMMFEDTDRFLMVCPQCMNKLPMDSKFCPKCGTDFIPKTRAVVLPQLNPSEHT